MYLQRLFLFSKCGSLQGLKQGEIPYNSLSLNRVKYPHRLIPFS